MKLLLIILGLGLSCNTQAQQPSDLQQARDIVASFSKALKSTLKPALKQLGPVAAINVCTEAAPRLAMQFSATTDWQVSRTSLKNRNPQNAPDQWEQQTLQLFEQQKAQGKDITQLEHWQLVTQQGTKVLRYMKAIPTAAKPCLACHGSNINPKIQAQLTASYPLDKATGYQVGDIRGAFSLKKQL
ncbi:MAG: DUF3365 domain-containing protein [Gammaproteobacteria bacterium]|nr:DUF3365 domain-containing protein [Gammaproteobacteria bacterium]